MKRALLLLVLLQVSGTALSQRTSKSEASTFQVEQLSDEELVKFMERAQQSGYSDEQIELMARARGLTSLQISQLKQRIDALRVSRTQGSPTSKVTTGRERLATEITNKKELSNTGGTDPFDELSLESDSLKEDSLPIFGMSFFTSEALTFEPSLNVATPKNYQLGPGDQIVVDVYGMSENTYELEITPDGYVKIPSVGIIYVNGLTVEDAAKVIRSRLRAIYSTLGNGTQAQISLGQIRTIKVNVIGEVARPGTYSVSSFATAFNVLYLAGGPLESGSLRQIEIFRGGVKVAVLDAYDFLISGNGSNLVLQDQDVVMIRPYCNRVAVEGEIKRPAYYETLPGETLAEVIHFAGGFTERAYRKSLAVRRNLENSRTVKTVLLDELDSFLVKTGDEIFVDQITNIFRGRIRIEGAVNHPGEFSLNGGMKLSELIELADGFRGDVYKERALIIREESDFTLSSIPFSPQAVLKGEFDMDLKSEDLVKVQSIFDMRELLRVSIEGEVQDPGEFPFVEGMTIEDLIYLAKGFRNGAAHSYVEVARRNHSNQAKVSSEVFTFSIDQRLTLAPEGAGFVLQPFDIVMVRRSPLYDEQKLVEVVGEVNLPGKYAILNKDERISDIIRRAGGTTDWAFASGATLIRRTEYYDDNSTGLGTITKLWREDLQEQFVRDSTATANPSSQFKRQERIGIELAKILQNPHSKFDMVLKEGDIIYVPSALQTVRVRGEVLHPSTVRYEGMSGLRHFVSSSGGFTDRAKKSKVYVIYPNGSSKRSRNFLFVKVYPQVLPGAEIIVPEKPERRRISPQEIIGMASGLASVALLLDRVLN